ncbi:MAG: YwaF family protein [Firmicutes bacterium]|nr:YwaF family protein [Bacillota bacterium]MBR5488306.1 YwaF family protein [Bacillota bacterium]
MYGLLSEILSDKKDGAVFSCFGIWHLACLFVVMVVLTAVVFHVKKYGAEERQKLNSYFINCAFGLYIADFFLMPFAYGEIDIEKLPFHACTAMCVMCFLSGHNGFLGKFRLQFAMLGLVSNLVDLIYPAGLMWYQVHPLSYRVIQTLLFHGLMTGYGLLVLLVEDNKREWKKDLAVITTMTAWALLGNTLYNGYAWGKTHFFNWFFVVWDPFYILPEQISPIIMPFLNIVLFMAVETLLYKICCDK